MIFQTLVDGIDLVARGKRSRCIGVYVSVRLDVLPIAFDGGDLRAFVAGGYRQNRQKLRGIEVFELASQKQLLCLIGIEHIKLAFAVRFRADKQTSGKVERGIQAVCDGLVASVVDYLDSLLARNVAHGGAYGLRIKRQRNKEIDIAARFKHAFAARRDKCDTPDRAQRYGLRGIGYPEINDKSERYTKYYRKDTPAFCSLSA